MGGVPPPAPTSRTLRTRLAAALFTAAQTYSEVKETSSGRQRPDSDINSAARNIRRFGPPPPPLVLAASRSDTSSRPLSRRRDNGVPECEVTQRDGGRRHQKVTQPPVRRRLEVPLGAGGGTRPVLRCWGQRGCCSAAATPKLMHDGPCVCGETAEFKGRDSVDAELLHRKRE